MTRHLQKLIGLAVLAAVAAIPPTSAHEYKAGGLTIVQPWSRATPGGAGVGAGYLKITNTGNERDRLVGGSAAVAERFELHQTVVSDGVARMRTLEDGLEIRPGETVELRPGGVHIMLVNLKGPLREGSRFSGTLTFERAGTTRVEFVVQGLGASGGGARDHGGQHGHGGPTR